MAKIKLVHVSLQRRFAGVTDLVGGHVQIMFNNLISVMGLVKQNRLHALGITERQTFSATARPPHRRGIRVRRYESGSWYGALLPANTPQNIVATLNREMVKALKIA